MAINIVEVPRDKICTSSHSSFKHHKQGTSASSHLNKVDFATESGISGLTNRLGKRKKRADCNSPYLKADSVKMLSRVTEKRLIRKNGDNMASPFPLGTNVYKFDSNDSKSSRKGGKKMLKSAITQPKDPATFPQLSTESDITESEYCNEKNNIICKNNKKRNKSVHTRKCRSRPKDRDEKYLTSMDIHLDSSNDTLKKFDNRRHKRSAESKENVEGKFNPHDVWAVLRNINRFQFIPSPDISEHDFILPKKKNRRNNRSDMRVFETRRTEEFAYISSYIEASPCHSHSSSFDKVTVINKKQDIKFNKEIEDKLKKKKTKPQYSGLINRTGPKSKAFSVKCNNIKELTYVKQKESDNSVKSGEELSDAIDDTNFKDPKEMLKINASVDLGYESKTTEYDDQTSFDNDTTQMSQNGEAVYSDNSGSSKAAFLKSAPRKKVKGKTVVTDNVDKTVSGITKVVLRGHNANQPNQHNNMELTKQIVRPISKDATNNINTPKLTKIDINRQVNKYRYPIVVLGKDQLKSPLHIISNNHLQFDGLDEQIWPFMMSWYGIERSEKVMKRPLDSVPKKVKCEEVEKRSKLSNNSPTRHSKFKDKITKIEPRRAPLPLSEIINQVAQDKRKVKPMCQFKDRMLKLLYKKPSVLKVVDESLSSELVKKEKSSKKVDTCTDTTENFNDSKYSYDVYCTSLNNVNDTSSINNTKVSTAKKQPYVENRSWAKAKWASDFIDNVIKKIKSGVYYNKDSKDHNAQTLAIENNDEEIQTDLIFESMQVIPGFDKMTPEIEIKTMNMNEVAVKHCVTNIVVQFDVAVPTKPIIYAENSSSLVPVDVTQNLNKIFKYKTSIYNAMLPAELCSILPKMLRKIVESQEHLKLSPIPMDKISCLSTISEIPTEYSSDNMNLKIPNILPFLQMTEKIRKILNGKFSNKETKASSHFYVIADKAMLVNDKIQLIEELRPRISKNQLFELRNPLMMPLVIKNQNAKISTTPSSNMNYTSAFNTCEALQPFLTTERKVHAVSMLIKISGNMPNYFEIKNQNVKISTTPSSNFNHTNAFNTCEALQPSLTTERKVHTVSMPIKISGNMANYMNNILPLINMFRLIDNSCTNVNTNISNLNNIPAVLTVRIEQPNTCTSCLTTNSKLSILPNVSDTPATKSQNCAGNLKLSACGVKKPFEINSAANITKMKRKSFVKLNRKCKSASHIYEEKATQLSRITTPDDFFQVFGSAKLLASVFDDRFGRKLMSSIQETKNWATEINSRQALLILLLANKKETQNLLRYRPVILQGIAVKRITKAHELDMEIELIERENLGGIPQYEGISYLAASDANQEFLYDELCWIAKNTASDYQKPFDQSSERLLKSLLEKRKKLNPSYLRVMARYVGLGLLKSPGKN